MKPKLLIIFLLIALLPLVILAWMGIRLINSERVELERGLENVYLGKLKDHDATISKVVEKRKRKLLKISSNIETRFKINAILRKLRESNRDISHLFLLDNKGERIFPSNKIALSESEKHFLQRTQKIWEGKLIPLKNGKEKGKNNPSWQLNVKNTKNLPAKHPSTHSQQTNNDYPKTNQQIEYQQKLITTNSPLATNNNDNDEAASTADSGWITWFWENGIHLIHWIRLADGRIIGAEFNRADLIADIIAELPNTDPFGRSAVSERVVLSDASNKAIYQWGTYEVPDSVPASATHSLSFPLNTWELKFYPNDSARTSSFAKSSILNLFVTLLFLAVFFIFLAIYFYREHSREMREAATRVSFVNRVSHELKTPLTNIRMYAELLSSRLEDSDSKSRQQIDVISSESERLSRLITNVLTFSKEQNGKLRLRKQEGIIDEIVKNIIARFEQIMENSEIVITSSYDAGTKVKVDQDILEQILINILSNIEKYASMGKSANIATNLKGSKAIITISDKGPGIPAKFAESVFSPFFRIDNKLSEGTSGTGIGLNIARELARRHGGDIKLLASSDGAVFEIQLDIA